VLFPAAVALEVEDAYATVLAAHDAAVAAIAPGVPCEDVDRAAREVIAAGGHGERFVHRLGHGLGLEIHEPPYLRAGNPQPLEVGHVFSVEPGIYVHGAYGLRFETIYHLGPDGPEPLNRAPRRVTTAPAPSA
jgi:Xaa-Pro aminopeptidase